MHYKNAAAVLPEALVAQIQEYIQGEYLYIPVKERVSLSATDYQTELQKRDAHIYTRHLEGMSNPRLSRLYHLSQSSIRRILSKQRKEFEKMREQIINAAARWGLGSCPVRQIYDTAWQIGEEYVLKIYQDLGSLERNIQILDILDRMQIPVGKPVPALDGAAYVAGEGVYLLLTRRLRGSNLVELQERRDMAWEMGRIIADLHLAFRQCEGTDTFWENDFLAEMRGWVAENFQNQGWSYVSQGEFESTVSALAAVYSDLPVQLIHRDIHFGNFLFDNGAFSGYIDFDLSQRNIRIFDLCYFLLGLLSEEEKLGLTEEVWFRIVRDVFAGYESRLEITAAEKEAVPCVMECIELLFTAFFAGIRDECCAQSACRIFRFVKDREDRIRDAI